MGCFFQSGASSTSTGKVLTSFIQTYTTSGNVQCSAVCNSQNFDFYGTVNVGTTSVDCYCGDTLNFVSTYCPRLITLVWTSCWGLGTLPEMVLLTPKPLNSCFELRERGSAGQQLRSMCQWARYVHSRTL